MVRRRHLIAAIALTAAVAGCSAETPDAAQPSTAAPTSGGSSTPTPKPSSENISEGLYTTHAEALYVKSLGYKYNAYGPINLPKSVLDDGHEYCDGPPSVGFLIEAIDRDDTDLDLYKAATRYLCPKYLPAWRAATRGFTEGDKEIGVDIKPGVYRTVDRKVKDCYWERTTKGGDTIANRFVNFAPSGVTVTIAPTDGGFTSRGCGNWAPA
ncbi:hypothetical protein ABT340_39660 [Streptosporangium sp. NPDC000239]|uniref:hypothetical protein n=1 Tax=Streptosporangium sp. NPDC000239 TaxID=3154248 RepID=UPI00331B987F